MDYLLSARRPVLVIVTQKKRTCPIDSADHWVKQKESEKKDKYVDSARELKKKTWNMKVTVLPIAVRALGTVTKELIKKREDLEVSGDNPNYSIVEIGQNTEKSPGDLKRFAITWIPVEVHQLILVWKILKRAW